MPRSPNRKWLLVHLFLTGSYFATAALSFVLSHRVMAIYSESVDVNQAWADRLGSYTRLSRLAQGISAPGTDVFRSGDATAEAIRLKASLRHFGEAVDEAVEDLEAEPFGEDGARFREALRFARNSAEEMAADTANIFACIGKNDIVEAGRLLAARDEKLAALNRSLESLRASVRDAQREQFGSQLATAGLLADRQYFVCALFVVLVACVTIYGHRIARSAVAAELQGERHLAAFEEGELRTLAIVDSAIEGIITIDDRGTIRSFNAAAQRLFGYEPHEVMGKNVSMLMPQPYADEYDDRLRRYLETGEGRIAGISRETEGRRKDGSAFPIELAVSETRLGGSRMFTGILSDVTERKRNGEALSARARQQAAVAALGHAALTGASLEGLMNQAVEQVSIGLCVELTEVLELLPEMNELCLCAGKGWKQAIVGSASISAAINESQAGYTLLSREPVVVENAKLDTRFKRSAHLEEHGVTSGVSVLILGDKGPFGVLGAYTQQQRTFSDDDIHFLQAVSSVLAAAIVLRGIPAELESARDQAVESSRLKSEFLANTSYEIRTPMNGVIEMIGLVLDSSLSDDQREPAEMVQSSANALLTVINDILDFLKMEAGKLAIEPIPFDLRVAVEDIAELLAGKAGEKGIEIVTRFAVGVPRHLIGDPGRVRQVLTNLAGNAVQLAQKGHVLINVECESQDAREARLRISVEDTGIGIPEDEIGILFDKFTQPGALTAHKNCGAGLGLAISKKLAVLMGGSIGVENRPGKGSTFWFRLPLSIDLEAASKAAPPIADLAGVRMLVVDDEDLNRRVLEEQLAGWSVRVSSARGPEEALAELRSARAAGDPYGIALLDYMMPVMDGEVLGRAIKVDPGLAETALVLLASAGLRGDAKRAADAGFAGYLVKPIRQMQLREALSTVWGAKTLNLETRLVTSHTLAEARAAKAAQAAAVSHLNAHVLVVEDIIVNQKVAVRMLERLGCRVDVAVNGQEALVMADSSSYDMLLMDCQMPELDGYAATVEIRRREEGGSRHVPIIAMTACGMQGDRERCLAAGMDDYLSKPVKSDALQAMLERWAKKPPA